MDSGVFLEIPSWLDVSPPSMSQFEGEANEVFRKEDDLPLPLSKYVVLMSE